MLVFTESKMYAVVQQKFSRRILTADRIFWKLAAEHSQPNVTVAPPAINSQFLGVGV